jgi:sec-independent protein translocase protein TatA
MLDLNTFAFMSMPMGAEWLVIAALGLLIFGKRLPEVGKGIGQAIVQFKKGLKSVEDDIEQVDAEPAAKRLPDATASPSTTAATTEQKFDPYTGKPIDRPKFDPYTGKPVDEPTSA